MTAHADATSTAWRGSRPVPLRAVLLLPGAVALLAGLDAALMLLGLPAPVTTDRLPDVHGMLMVAGFLGTVVALERATAAGRAAAFAAPALLGLGALLLVSAAPLGAARTALVCGAAGLVAVYVPLWRRQRDDAVVVQALGAVLLLGATVLWAGGVPVPDLLPWLAGFVVLTVAGERVELARIDMGPSAGPAAVLLASAMLVAVVAALLWPPVGSALLGAVLLCLTGWLAGHDAARRTVRGSGLQRYMAWCLLAAYLWLVVAGAIWLVGGPATEGAGYDAVVHAVFLGFAISMVMAHAPVILPAVLRRQLPYRPALYLPVCLLHGSLALRLWAGDAVGNRDAWLVGGALNIASILAFVLVAAWSAVRGPVAHEAVR